MVDWKKLRENIEADKHRFYILISGDKSLRYDSYVVAVLDGTVSPLDGRSLIKMVSDKVLSKAKKTYNEIKVITGDNSGTDSMAQEYALSNNHDVMLYEADWDSNGSKAGFMRNEDMFLCVGSKEHKGALLFWNGEDYMTRNLIYQAYRYGVPLRVYNYVLKRVLTEDEVKDIQYEENNKQMKYQKY